MKIRLRKATDWLLSDWGLKLTALGLAFLIWALARADSPAFDVIDNVPVQVVMRDAAWDTVGGPAPSVVAVRVSGPVRELARLRMSDPPVVRLVVDGVEDSVRTITLQERHVLLGGGDGLVVESITPDQVRLDFDPVEHALVPVAPRVRGAPVPGFALSGPVIADPPEVRASGARRRLARVDSIRLQPVDLSARRGVDTVTLSIDTTGTGLLITPLQVRVTVPMVRIPPDSMVADTLGATFPPDTATAPPVPGSTQAAGTKRPAVTPGPTTGARPGGR